MVYCLFIYESIGYIFNMFMLGREVVIFLDIMYSIFKENE